MNKSLKINPNINEVLDYNTSTDLLQAHFKTKKP
jgi:hypothetical protein